MEVQRITVALVIDPDRIIFAVVHMLGAVRICCYMIVTTIAIVLMEQGFRIPEPYICIVLTIRMIVAIGVVHVRRKAGEIYRCRINSAILFASELT